MRLERGERADIWGSSAPGRGNSPRKGTESGRCLVLKGETKAKGAGADTMSRGEQKRSQVSSRGPVLQGAVSHCKNCLTLLDMAAIGLLELRGGRI